jgi:hypothetical protein
MRYLYYKIYKILTKIKTNKTPAFSALVMLITLQGANILTILTLIKHFCNIKFDKNYLTLESLLLFIALIIPNYFFLYSKQNIIIKKYANESKEDNTWGYILLILYVLITFAAIFIVGKST